jgi:hypothetical protein
VFFATTIEWPSRIMSGSKTYPQHTYSGTGSPITKCYNSVTIVMLTESKLYVMRAPVRFLLICNIEGDTCKGFTWGESYDIHNARENKPRPDSHKGIRP